PPFNPFWIPIRFDELGRIGCSELFRWDGAALGFVTDPWVVLLARLFYLNWLLLLLNVALPGFPLDGGRMFQALLWPRLGFHRAMQWAVMAGFGTMLVLGVASIALNEVLLLCLA